MLLILEGIDGSGKTSLAKVLRAKSTASDVTVLHRGPPESPNPFEEYVVPLSQYHPGTNTDVICDRWHIGELIYGPLYRGVSTVTRPDQHAIEMFLNSVGAVLIHVTAGLDIIERRLQRRGETFLQPEHVAPVFNMYRDEIRNSAILHNFEYDTSYDNGLDQSIQGMCSLGRRAEEASV